jgi:hypothetical protein
VNVDVNEDAAKTVNVFGVALEELREELGLVDVDPDPQAAAVPRSSTAAMVATRFMSLLAVSPR